jgi:hypothetical protein
MCSGAITGTEPFVHLDATKSLTHKERHYFLCQSPSDSRQAKHEPIRAKTLLVKSGLLLLQCTHLYLLEVETCLYSTNNRGAENLISLQRVGGALTRTASTLGNEGERLVPD